MAQVLDNPVIHKKPGAGSNQGVEPMYQVVLYNDDHNPFDKVILLLMQIFGHTQDLAIKIAMEAHTSGRAVAEVEEKELAIQHKQQLVSAGLTAEAEPIS